MDAAIVACVDAAPVLYPAEHVFDFMALTIEDGDAVAFLRRFGAIVGGRAQPEPRRVHGARIFPGGATGRPDLPRAGQSGWGQRGARSEERRVGEGGVSTSRVRWSTET